MFKKLILVGLISSSFAWAGQCDSLYPNNTEIAPIDTIELCNSFYVSRFNQKTQGVILTSEVVRPTKTKTIRSNDFHPDTRVPFPVSPKQYTRTGFDKGHMTPAGDARSDKEMSETFLMTNMTPQEPTLNRGPWQELEEYIRRQVNSQNQPAKVVTGAVYTHQPKQVNGVPVPQSYYKIIYYGNGIVESYYADNVKYGSVKKVTVEDLETFSGLKF